MPEITATFVVDTNEITITPSTSNIDVAVTTIPLSVYSLGYAQPGGSTTQLQYNNGGVFGGVPYLVYANGNVQVNNLTKLKIVGGANAYFLQTDGTGNLTWAPGTVNANTGNGIAVGANTQIQITDGTGNFVSAPGFTYDTANFLFTVPGDGYFAGNVTAQNFFGNANISNLVANNGIFNNITVNNNINGNTANFSGNVAALGVLTDNLYYANGQPYDFEQPGGINTAIQFNDANDFGGSNAFTFDKTSNAVTLTGNLTTGNANLGNLITANYANIGNITAGNVNLSNGNLIVDSLTANDITLNSQAVGLGGNAGVPAGSQGYGAVAIGYEAQQYNNAPVDQDYVIAIGGQAGRYDQHEAAIAIGGQAGQNNQGNFAIAIGGNAAGNIQGISAIAIGAYAGDDNQGTLAIAIGGEAGKYAQGNSSIAIGAYSGNVSQGSNAIAIGAYAGNNAQANNSIILNATGIVLDANVANAFYVKPLRNANTGSALFYDSTTGEITYSSAISGSQISNGTSNVNIPAANGNVNISSNGSNVVTISNTGVTITGNLSVSGNYSGNISATQIANGTSNVTIPVASGNITISVAGSANRFVISGTDCNIAGNTNVQALRLAANNNITFLDGRVRINATNSGFGNSQVIIGANGVGNNANSIALGNVAVTTLGANSVAIGTQATAFAGDTVSVGYGAGGGANVTRGTYIGYQAGQVPNGIGPAQIAIGALSGWKQGNSAISIGYTAGYYQPSSQGPGDRSVAIGLSAGRRSNANATALGAYAGYASNTIQGSNSTALGHRAGFNDIHDNTTIINSTGSDLDSAQANSFYVKPIRNVSSANVLMYNSTTGEITYDTLQNYSTYVKTISTTVGSLIAASTAGAGSRAFVTDANTTTFYNIVGSGGANSVPVFSDGTSWRVG